MSVRVRVDQMHGRVVDGEIARGHESTTTALYTCVYSSVIMKIYTCITSHGSEHTDKQVCSLMCSLA